MRSLDIDLETFSSVDLTKSGVYPYAEAKDFDILLFAYSVDGGPVEIVDLAAGEEVPGEIIDALTENNIIKTSFNAAFERICLSIWMRRKFPEKFKGYSTAAGETMPFLDPRGWRCSMVWASSLGLPRSLKDVGSVLGLEEQKMAEGAALIRYFCMPCKPTKANSGRTRNLPLHSPEKWTTFKAYNKRDVEVEMNILNRLSRFPMPPWLWEQFFLDQEINDRGILIDRGLVRAAIRMGAEAKEQALSRMREITSLPNPGSVAQMKGWLSERGVEADSLDKKAVSALLRGSGEVAGEVAEVLALRGQVSKASVSKYKAMEAAACSDGRCRGMFKFGGASRTFRWSSTIIQLQNLARNEMPDLAEARTFVRNGDFETLALLYPSVSGVLSELVRTAFIPRPGFKFIVADFSAIEARVLSFMAGEMWRIDLFNSGGDIYCQSASKMFGVPVEKHGINSKYRKHGKLAELSCGYGGGTGALKNMGALEMGIPEEELPSLVSAWRAANPSVVRFWWDVDRAAKRAITEGERTEVRGLRFEVRSDLLFIRLPSGRRLAYVKPEIGMNKFGGESITYEGTNIGKWTRLETYGPKLVENCIAGGTLVITDRGLIPIEDVTRKMKVWDGEGWVSHDGCVWRGERKTISVGGVRMTPDHRILTKRGWIEGGKADGFDWADVPLPDGPLQGGKQQAGKATVAVPMRLREDGRRVNEGPERQEAPTEVLRVHEGEAYFGGENPPWHEPSPGVRRLAFDETAVHGPEPSRLPQLRRAGDNRVRPLEGQLRELLGGHGADMEEGSRPRPDRQRCGILGGELPLDYEASELPKQTEHEDDRDPILEAPGIRRLGTDRDWRDHAPLQDGSRMAGRIPVQETGLVETVYDIFNCGPYHRFAVWNGDRPCIVSNCIQAVSRDILAEAMGRLSPLRIVAHVHDEVIIEAPLDLSVESVCERMAETPPWMPGLLLKADGYECMAYEKR